MSRSGGGNASSQGKSGTPGTLKPLSREEINALSVTCPVKNVDTAHTYLEAKGWILTAEPYDHTKLANILHSVTQCKLPPEATAAIRAVAFILEADLIKAQTSTITSAITNAISPIISSIKEDRDKAKAFLDANEIQRANDTLSLQNVASALSNSIDALNKISKPLSPFPALPSSPNPPTWPSLPPRHPPPHPRNPPFQHNPAAAPELARVHQRVIQDARTALIQIDSKDSSAPSDRSPAGLAKLRSDFNEMLTRRMDPDLGMYEDSPAFPTAALRGLHYLKYGAFLLDFDSADSARYFRDTIATEDSLLIQTLFGATARFKPKSYELIIKFVPCNGSFSPSDRSHLDTIERDNNLPNNSIISASWIKPLDRRRLNQAFAHLKLSCSSRTAANTLLREKIYIDGRVVKVEKEIAHPLRCSKCQHFGHTRADCKNQPACSQCASTEHSATDCVNRDTPRCVSCGTNSNHPSSSRKCPLFIKKCEELTARRPENRMAYFPTEEEWTWSFSPINPSTPHPPNPPAPFSPLLPPRPTAPTLTSSPSPSQLNNAIDELISHTPNASRPSPPTTL